MPAKLTQNEFISRSKLIHGDKYDYSQVHYVNKDTKVEIICPEHGSFWQSPNNHMKGKGCPKCKSNYKMTRDDFVEKANQIHNNFYDYSDTVFVRTCDIITIRCPEHGLFSQTANSHLQGHGCPECGKVKLANHDYSQRVITRCKTCEEKYGVDNPMKSAKVVATLRQTFLEKYGVDNPLKNKCVLKKVFETRKHNGTLNTSYPEEKMYQSLCDRFGECDVYRQYKSKEYPFACDFYIKSKDLYIELNASWTHGFHFYNNASNEDLIVLKDWQSKAKTSKYYKNAIHVWTKLDVQKRQTAIDNNLNYIVFWNNDLTDFNLWLSLDCPIGNDAIEQYSWLK